MRFFQTYGVQEYYVYDPEENTLDIWRRADGQLIGINAPAECMSPLLGIRLVRSPEQLTLYHPDGNPFTSYPEECDRANQEQSRAEKLAAKLRELGVDPDTLD